MRHFRGVRAHLGVHVGVAFRFRCVGPVLGGRARLRGRLTGWWLTWGPWVPGRGRGVAYRGRGVLDVVVVDVACVVVFCRRGRPVVVVLRPHP